MVRMTELSIDFKAQIRPSRSHNAHTQELTVDATEQRMSWKEHWTTQTKQLLSNRCNLQTQAFDPASVVSGLRFEVTKPDEVVHYLVLFNVCLVTAFVRANLQGLHARKAAGAKSVWNRSASRFRHSKKACMTFHSVFLTTDSSPRLPRFLAGKPFPFSIHKAMRNLVCLLDLRLDDLCEFGKPEHFVCGFRYGKVWFSLMIFSGWTSSMADYPVDSYDVAITSATQRSFDVSTRNSDHNNMGPEISSANKVDATGPALQQSWASGPCLGDRFKYSWSHPKAGTHRNGHKMTILIA